MIEKATDNPGNLIQVMVLALLLAACSILYELLAAQTLSVLAANTVVWYSLVVGLFLASMGMGAFFSEKTGRESPWRALVRFEILLTILGSITVLLIHAAHSIYAQHFIRNELTTGLLVFYGTAVPIVCTLGILTGAELPLLMRLARQIRDETRSANLALGWDYLGSLVGAMLFPLVILPNVGLIAAGLLIAAVNLAVATWILLNRLHLRACIVEAVGIVVVALGLGAAAVNVTVINQYFLERYYYFHLMDDGLAGWLGEGNDYPPIVEQRSPYQTIHLVKNPKPSLYSDFLPAYSNKEETEPDFPFDYVLYLNGSMQTDTRYEEVYHEWFAHVPISMSGRIPKKVLVMGGGDGYLVRELLKYDDIAEIHHVDIDSVLVEFAKTNEILRSVNKASLTKSRVSTFITDGYQYVRQTSETYDAIFIDFPNANNYDLAKLYNREFYEFIKKRIRPGGFAVFDSSGTSKLTMRDEHGNRNLHKLNTWSIFSNTLMQAGFKTIVPYYSTLETNNPVIRKMVEDRKVMLDKQTRRELQESIPSPARRFLERRKRLRQIRQRLNTITADYMLQGFIFIAPDDMTINRTFAIPESISLHILNADRYQLSFTERLPLPDQIDRSQVNSIVRPTLPLSPWWRPMVSF